MLDTYANAATAYASMEPLTCVSGNTRTACRSARIRPRFNGAAHLRERKLSGLARPNITCVLLQWSRSPA